VSILNISEEDLRLCDQPGKGSLKIDEDELNAAFEFFDPERKGRLTAKDLHSKLTIFYPNLCAKDVKALITEPVFTKDVLRRLLENNHMAEFDPVKQAFHVYDPNGTGFVDLQTLARIFSDLGFGDITQEDFDVLIEASDVDGDGRISLSDFREMLSFGKAADADAAANKGGVGLAAGVR
jgi:Ca2+-binding EF-hand superfamily protein